VALAFYYFRREAPVVQSSTTFPVRRGPLEIAVLEGGSIEALESQQIKSEVEGETKILSIVDEGYSVTQEDITAGKILVELDSKKLVDIQISQELDYLNSMAAFTEAREEFEIQLNQNRSDIKAAQLLAKFARLDFTKYLGVEAAQKIFDQLGIKETDLDINVEAQDLLDASYANIPATPADGLEATVAEEAAADPAKAPTAAPPEEKSAPRKSTTVDFAQYADLAFLGDGEARQLLRKLEDDAVLAKKELGLAQTQFEGTQRLADRDFVTTTELENEKLKVERSTIAMQSAETSKELFVKYTFPKEGEKLLSDYEESIRKLERAQKLAVSKLAQADAKRKSAEARYNLQKKNRAELLEQIGKCKIRAEKPGMVVYGGNADDWHGNSEPIKEGTSIRERQAIIQIPDMSQMGVKVKVHESAIKNIQKGQKARIRVDAYPEVELMGEVVKVGVLPDSANRWMNPDLKVYATGISIAGEYPWMKPGMSAQVEILVKTLPDVLYVPIQAVVPSEGQKICYVAGLGRPARRVIEVGEFNNEFIEIKNGLKEGEKVLLRAPVVPEDADKKKREGKGEEQGKGEGVEKGQEERPPRGCEQRPPENGAGKPS
jgi:multidrug resistance efflux pump